MAIPLSPPTTLGEPLTHWSLRRLKAYLERRRVVSHIAAETLRCILREKNITFQRTRTWKRSTDPAFEEKTTRIMALYRTCPSDGVVVCFDEFGPISLQPYPGHCYAQQATVEAAGHIRAPRGVSATSSALTTCLDGRSQGRAGRNTDIDQSPQSHRVPLPTPARICAECVRLRQPRRGRARFPALPPSPQYGPSAQPHPSHRIQVKSCLTLHQSIYRWASCRLSAGRSAGVGVAHW